MISSVLVLGIGSLLPTLTLPPPKSLLSPPQLGLYVNFVSRSLPVQTCQRFHRSHVEPVTAWLWVLHDGRMGMGRALTGHHPLGGEPALLSKSAHSPCLNVGVN